MLGSLSSSQLTHPWRLSHPHPVSKTEPPHATHLTQRIARRGERFGGLDLNFLVGNRREITFVLQARPPRAPCDAYEQNAKYESGYMHGPRSAHGVHKVCAWCACAVRGWRAC